MVRISAGDARRAQAAVEELTAAGVDALLSWGLCGGLAPDLSIGSVVECDPRDIYSPDTVLTTPEEKAAAFAEGYSIVDLESGAVARAGLPAHAIRVVLDEAGFALPPGALVPLHGDGRPNLPATLRTTLSNPRSVPAMVSLIRRYRLAMTALRGANRRVGHFLDELATGQSDG